MTAETDTAGRGVPTARPARRRSWAWLGLVPFFLFATAFMFLPAAWLIAGSFQNSAGEVTLQNYADLSTGIIPDAFLTTIEVSLVTAIGGGIFGLLLAYAVILGGLPRILRTSLMTFSGVASNFAGVPLAFAFLATLGRLGLVTVLLREWFGINIYALGFNLLSFWGLTLTYLFFQIPLMILIVTPALDGLRREWREAAERRRCSPRRW